jgi:membrane protein required for colicin V production
LGDDMNGVDLALILALAACALRGYWRGFFRESFGVLALIGGVAAALQFTALGAAMVQEHVAMSLPPTVQSGVAFVALFVVAHTLVNLVGVVLDRLAGASRLRTINRLGGALFGVAKGGVVLAMALLFLHLLPVLPSADEHIMGSAVARPLVTAASNVLRLGAHSAQPESPSRT